MMEIFDYINSIFMKVLIKNFDSKKCNKVLLCYWLSQDPMLLKYVNIVNKYLWYLSDYQVYRFFFDCVPKGKRWLGKWHKGKKIKLTKQEQDQITLFKAQYHLSDKEINELLEMEYGMQSK